METVIGVILLITFLGFIIYAARGATLLDFLSSCIWVGLVLCGKLLNTVNTGFRALRVWTTAVTLSLAAGLVVY